MSIKHKLLRKALKHYALSTLSSKRRRSHWLAFTAAGLGAALVARAVIRRNRE
jgi:hypothetical protein